VLFGFEVYLIQIAGIILIVASIALTIISATDYIWNNRKVFAKELGI